MGFRSSVLSLVTLLVPIGWALAEDPWLVLEGQEGPGDGKHIVFVTGDEEYRSEEGMPQLAKILSRHHGFDCTVLFAIDEETGEIDPENQQNIPGTSRLKDADLMVIFTRFRDLPKEQMEPIVDYVESGRPIVGLRTSTHAFDMKKHQEFLEYSWRNNKRKGGFGRQVLGETWIAHHGGHGSQSTRGILRPSKSDHPILRGLEDGAIWDPSDVYTVRLPMLEGIEVLIDGQVVQGMAFDDPPAPSRIDEQTGKKTGKNDPMMPLAWTRTYETTSGQKARVFATTMGASQAFEHEGSRRLLVNACYWALGMEESIDAEACVDIVGSYEPTRFGFSRHRRGVKPSHLR